MAGNILAIKAKRTDLITANISAEQLTGMAKSGFAIRLGIATNEWILAATFHFVSDFLTISLI